MTRCAILDCGKTLDQNAGRLWQPFGPDENVLTFMYSGRHYRGFPVIRVCDDCQGRIRQGERIEFKYRGSRYASQDGQRPLAGPQCERCGEGLAEAEAVWLELDTNTNLYAAAGQLPAGALSQGCFPFGRSCARAVLANGGRVEKIRRGAR